MRKHIVVPIDVYEKLNQLKHELGKSTIADVVSELIKVYEGLKAVKALQLILQSLEDARKVVAMFNNALSTISQLAEQPQKSVETRHRSAPKEVSKSELTAYFKR
jgi:predicted CopG family antitoxin